MNSHVLKSSMIRLAGLAALCASLLYADVLVDNMENPDKSQSLSGGYWFMFFDARTHETGNTTLIWPRGYNFVFSPDGYRGTQCARINAKLGAGYRSPFVGMGMNLDYLHTWYDFTQVTTIEFRARGQGVFRLKLRDSWSVRETPEQPFECEFTVGPEWQQYSFRLKDFKAPAGSPIERSHRKITDVADSICSLVFVSASYQDRDAGCIVDLQVDDIVIRGFDRIGVVERNAPPAERISRRTEVGGGSDDLLDEGGSDEDMCDGPTNRRF